RAAARAEAVLGNGQECPRGSRQLLAAPALGPQALHNLGYEENLIREEGIERDEAIALAARHLLAGIRQLAQPPDHAGLRVICLVDLVATAEFLFQDAISEDQLDSVCRQRPFEPETPLDLLHVCLQSAGVLVDGAHILVRRDEDPDPPLSLDCRLLDERLELGKTAGVVLDPLTGLIEYE